MGGSLSRTENYRAVKMRVECDFCDCALSYSFTQYVMYEESYFAAAVLLQEPLLKPHLIFQGNFIYLLKYSTDGSKAIFSILGCNYDADKISNVWPMSYIILFVIFV